MYNYLQIYYVQGLMQEEYLKFLFLDILRKARLVVATNVYSLLCGMAVYFVLTRGDLQRRE
jgi:hypothetical protein